MIFVVLLNRKQQKRVAGIVYMRKVKLSKGVFRRSVVCCAVLCSVFEARCELSRVEREENFSEVK